MKDLKSGNVVVKSGFNLGTTATYMANKPEAEIKHELPITELSLLAYPNPSQNQFNLQIHTGKPNVPINLRILDQFGRTIEVKKGLSAGQTIQLGAGYKVGMYFVELIQGEERRQVKLIKQ